MQRLIRYRIPGTVAETLWSGVLPIPQRDVSEVLDRAGRPAEQATPDVWEQVFRDRPAFTAGSGWTAVRHPGDASIEVRFAGGTAWSVRWPQGARPHDSADASAIAIQEAHNGVRESEYGARMWRSRSAKQNRAYVNSIRDLLEQRGYLADSLPELTAAYGAGSCLWLAGVSSKDFIDGTALTLTGINLVRLSSTPVVYRIARPERRIRDITEQGVITTYRDDDNVAHLEWNPFPAPGCSGPP